MLKRKNRSHELLKNIPMLTLCLNMGIFLNAVLISYVPDGYLPAWQCLCCFTFLTSLSGTVLYMRLRMPQPPPVFRQLRVFHLPRRLPVQGQLHNLHTL